MRVRFLCLNGRGPNIKFGKMMGGLFVVVDFLQHFLNTNLKSSIASFCCLWILTIGARFHIGLSILVVRIGFCCLEFVRRPRSSSI